MIAPGKYVQYEIFISYFKYTALFNFIKVLNSKSFEVIQDIYDKSVIL